MKKLGIFAVLLSVALFVGCGKTEKAVEPKPAEPVKEATEDATPADEVAPVAPEKEAAKPAADDDEEGLLL